jgi:hypothetical protein
MTPPDSPLKETPLSETTTEEELLLGEEAKRSWKKENRQIIQLGLGVAAFMVIAHFTPLRAWITNVQVWKGYVRELGWLAHGGEFDSGSERTLAAWIRHASRTGLWVAIFCSV